MTYTIKEIADLVGLSDDRVGRILLKGNRVGKLGKRTGRSGARALEYSEADLEFVKNRNRPGRPVEKKPESAKRGGFGAMKNRIKADK
jgi:hypothetical protein